MIKVLLADDQELIRQSLSFVMSKQEDIEMVGTAANGCEALELVEEKQPDVVLLDIRMPEMDGVECTRRIKQEFQPRNTRNTRKRWPPLWASLRPWRLCVHSFR